MEEYESYEISVAECVEPVAVVEYPKVTRIKTDGLSAIDKIHWGDFIEYVFYIGGELVARIPYTDCRQKHIDQWLKSVTIYKKTGKRSWPGMVEEPVRNSLEIKEPAPVTRATFENNAGNGVYKYIPELHKCNPPYPAPPSGSIWQCAEQKDDGSFCDQEWVRSGTQWNTQRKVSAANAGWDESVREMHTYRPHVKRTKAHSMAIAMMAFMALCTVINLILVTMIGPFQLAFVAIGIASLALFNSIRMKEVERRKDRIETSTKAAQKVLEIKSGRS